MKYLFDFVIRRSWWEDLLCKFLSSFEKYLGFEFLGILKKNWGLFGEKTYKANTLR